MPIALARRARVPALRLAAASVRNAATVAAVAGNGVSPAAAHQVSNEVQSNA
jgi:hypothetical protein